MLIWILAKKVKSKLISFLGQNCQSYLFQVSGLTMAQAYPKNWGHIFTDFFYLIFRLSTFYYILLAWQISPCDRNSRQTSSMNLYVKRSQDVACFVLTHISLHLKLMERKATILRWFTMPLNSLNQFDYSCYRSTAILNGMYVFVCGGGLHCRSHDPFVCRHGSEINNVWRYLQFASPYLYPWCVASCSQYISLYVL